MSKSEGNVPAPQVADASRMPLFALNAFDENDSPSRRGSAPFASAGRSSARRKLAKIVDSAVGSVAAPLPDALGSAEADSDGLTVGSGVAVAVGPGVGVAVGDAV